MSEHAIQSSMIVMLSSMIEIDFYFSKFIIQDYVLQFMS